jgi:hypothetical protein
MRRVSRQAGVLPSPFDPEKSNPSAGIKNPPARRVGIVISNFPKMTYPLLADPR